MPDDPTTTADANLIDNPGPADPPTGGDEPLLNAEDSPFVNPDGTFIDGWKQYLPEDIREEECWNTVTDFNNMAKQFVHQRKAIGKDKITVPGKDAKPSDWDNFYKAIGRPETPEDYKVTIPEELAGIFDDARINEARNVAHKIGISQNQFAQYMEYELKAAADMVAEGEKLAQESRLEAEKRLRDEFKGAYRDRMDAARLLIKELMPNEEQRAEFAQKYGNDVDIIRILSTMAFRMKESSAEVALLRGDTPAEAERKIQELMEAPGYLDGDNEKMTPQERQALTDQIRELRKVTHPDQRAQSAYVGFGR